MSPSKPTMQALLLAFSLLPGTLADNPNAPYGAAKHRGNGASTENPPVANAAGAEKSRVGKIHNFAAANKATADGTNITEKCFTYTSDLDTWYYRNDGPWWSSAGHTGSFGRGPSQICVPLSDTAGGATFIGSTPDLVPGNTKVECFFPTHGSGNCDISLVDGYSLSVTCTAAGMKVGGDLNLWAQGNKCVAEDAGKGICYNEHQYAYGGNETGVTGFFQPGIRNGEEYCIWWACGQDYYFPWDVDEVKCHVSGGYQATKDDATTTTAASGGVETPKPTTTLQTSSGCTCAEWQCGVPTGGLGKM